ncbi:nucleoside 2-deoxyribosyltransferase [Paenibacillus tepidiphilus]|uniref:nucleoside 2-deoxyribosyltransferase n=1 Tax=Paenibacillus tepidiphilus TaxID=2608683 RepID=UPI00193D3C6E|nr:nucleoside 2-deoxyribosyltransferase [Paenibacillus tepidiphilus]
MTEAGGERDERDLYIVIAGVVAKCRKRIIGGETFYVKPPYDGRYRAVFRDTGNAADVEPYVFETKQEAQRVILDQLSDPSPLTWRAFGRPKIYLAGFHVFRPDAVEYGRSLRELCNEYGFEGLVPLDKENYDNLDRRETGTMIFYANEGLIREADIVMADLNPFRGAEPDSGTVFECGFGYALGKRVYGYISDGRSMRERLASGFDPLTGLYSDGMHVEDFDMPLNLMLSVSTIIVTGGLEGCLVQARKDYYGG